MSANPTLEHRPRESPAIGKLDPDNRVSRNGVKNGSPALAGRVFPRGFRFRMSLGNLARGKCREKTGGISAAVR